MSLIVLKAHALWDGQVKAGSHHTTADSHFVFLTAVNLLTLPPDNDCLIIRRKGMIMNLG